MITENEQKVYDALDDLGISYVRYEHEPVFTMEELNKVEIENARTFKNLFTRNRKGESPYLVIVEELQTSELKKPFPNKLGYVFDFA